MVWGRVHVACLGGINNLGKTHTCMLRLCMLSIHVHVHVL